jgi:hypothetical protein
MRALALRSFGLALIVAMLTPGQASAFDLPREVCTRSPFSACSFLRDWYMDGDDMIIVVENGAIASSPDIVASSFVGSILLKFSSASAIPAVNGLTVAVDAAPTSRDWRIANNVGSEAGFEWDERFNVDGRGRDGSANRLLPGETFTLTISFDGTVPTDLALANWGVKWQAIGTELNCDEFDDDQPQCSDWAVVPEPITMVLLGTGLAGVGGAAALRRRRRGHDVTDA